MSSPEISGLDEASVRVLGALIEKEFTTPDVYPLTLNATIAACNQTSNRDPVMQLDEATVSASLKDLMARHLVRTVHRSESRALRYRQALSESLNLHEPETAAMCVLLLRGPQTPGEIRARTGRMFAFRDPEHVQVTLESLMTLSTPLVTELPRRPGQKEARYAHLLAGDPDVQDAEPAGDAAAERVGALEAEVAELRSEVAGLRERLEAFIRAFE